MRERFGIMKLGDGKGGMGPGFSGPTSKNGYTILQYSNDLNV